ncbi:MAG: GNAT family N-acetyltransferase [Oscillospiraceae bacterium]|nr:GNAT family N-acetyltransferase [Oscillospiraceae bacterium]
MIKLVEINEQNWQDAVSLSVYSQQKSFLDSPVGIVARGYVYRSCNASVFGISNGEQIIGIALVKDMDEEPACYDLQQFMIDRHFQGKGYGTEALRLILLLLSKEGKYDQVEVCVNKNDAAALRMYKKVGFEDTGYIDESVPDCRNLMYKFNRDMPLFSDKMITDFSDLLFQNAFKQYFSELGCKVKDWNVLFKDMISDGGNAAFIRTSSDGKVIGFIQFKPIKFSSWFFEETCGFIREFWIAEEFRNKRHGTALIELVEKFFLNNGIYTSILTTDTAARFYEKRGYYKALGCKAKNQTEVFIKRLK